MTTYSQLNWLWRWKKLGFSSIYTIGSSGCCMTCYSMINDMRPDEMNEYLKNNKGFANVCLVIHAVAADARNRYRFDGFHLGANGQPVYDNAVAKAQIAKNGFCIVKLSNGKIPQHWVLFIGNQKMIDPLGGVVRPTSYYGNSYEKLIKLTKRTS